jgi:predicted acetyltransferase
MSTESSTPFRITVAHESNRATLERLWLLFRHDMSAFTGALPDPSGRFRQERLDAALRCPGWRGYLMTLGDAPVGLAVARTLDSDAHVLSSFVLVNGARGRGHGLAAARFVIQDNPGAWAIAFQDANVAAARFWRRVARDAVGDEWSEEHERVPGRPDLAPDTWIRFDTRALHTERPTSTRP